jgi:Family of unknown function (DUF6502)
MTRPGRQHRLAGQRARNGTPGTSRPSGGALDWPRDCLAPIARILVESGYKPERLSRDFTEACSRLKPSKERWDPTWPRYVTALPHVVAHWYSDPEYVDGRGRPIRLPLKGQGPCLQALIRRVLPGRSASRVAASLVRLGAVRRLGDRYVPNGRHAICRGESARAHALTTVRAMLSTVEHNMTHDRGAALFERMAMNPNFPENGAAAFYRIVRILADALLSKADDEMTRQEKRVGGGSRVRMGVGIYVFRDPLPHGEEAQARSGADPGGTQRILMRQGDRD